jgi:branched-chain amino acid transport system substrate-binding protein
MKRRSLITTAGSGLVAAVLIAGCSSSPSGRSSAAGSSGNPQAAQGNIPVGVVGTFSGPEGTTTGSSKFAIEAWADAVNAAGGINGRHVQLYVEDDAGNPATSLVEVKTLVQEDHVVAIVGEESISAQPWASYVAAQDVPVIGGNSAEKGLYALKGRHSAASRRRSPLRRESRRSITATTNTPSLTGNSPSCTE